MLEKIDTSLWLCDGEIVNFFSFPYHRPSRAVIVADLIEALDDDFLKMHWSWWRRVLGHRVLGHLDGITAEKSLAPAEWRLSFIHRRPARAARNRVLGWPAERVIMAHGDWLRAGGRAYLKRSFRWLGTN